MGGWPGLVGTWWVAGGVDGGVVIGSCQGQLCAALEGLGNGQHGRAGGSPAVELRIVPARSQVVGVAATFADVWRLVSATLAELDLLAAFAEVAAAAPSPYVRPTMLPSEGASSVWGGGRLPGCKLCAADLLHLPSPACHGQQALSSSNDKPSLTASAGTCVCPACQPSCVPPLAALP